MSEIRDELRADILAHAREEFPRECCGLVIVEKGRERYVRCRNTAKLQTQFIMDPEDYAAAEERGEIVAVVHSHCNVPVTPSQADLVACEASGLPWIIVQLPYEHWEEFRPKGYKAPLVGRVWTHGVLDCYTLIQDWFREERGLVLDDFDRREFWWKQGDDLYMKNFESQGFRKLEAGEKFEVGDVLLMQIGSAVANHAAIWVGDDLILHHLMDRLSSRDIYGGYWRKNTRAVVRYAGP